MRHYRNNHAVSSSNWLFGSVLDPAIFMAPPLCAWLLVFLVPHLESDTWKVAEKIIIIICIIVLDRSHTFATFVRVLGSHEERKNYGRRLIFVSAAMLVAFFGIHVWSQSFFWTAATYLTIWHVLRQQAGLAIYAEDKASPLIGKKQRLGATAPLYLLWIGTLLSLHATDSHTLGWYGTGELIQLPKIFRTIGFILSLLGVWAFVIWIVFCYFKRKSMSPTAIVIWLSSLTGSALIWTHDPREYRVSLILAISVVHSLSYLAATAVVVEHRGGKKIWIQRLQPKLMSYGVTFVLATLTLGSLWQIIGFRSLDVLSNLHATEWILALANTVFMLPVFVHNIADGWLWRRSSNRFSLKPFISGADNLKDTKIRAAKEDFR